VGDGLLQVANSNWYLNTFEGVKKYNGQIIQACKITGKPHNSNKKLLSNASPATILI